MGRKYPTIVKQWRLKWTDIITLFDFPPPIRKAIYTTNAIESVNSVIRKFTRNRKQYPNAESALKLVYMAIHEASKHWTMPIRDWKAALNHFAIVFEDRLPGAVKRGSTYLFQAADTKTFTGPREPGTDQTGTTRGLVERRVMDLLALAAPARMRANANDRDHFTRQRQLDLLNDLGRQFAGHDGSVAVRAFHAVKLGVINLVIRKHGPLMTRMAWLGTTFAFLAVLGLVLGLLDDVAGRRLGRVGGILFGGGEFRAELRNFHS